MKKDKRRSTSKRRGKETVPRERDQPRLVSQLDAFLPLFPTHMGKKKEEQEEQDDSDE
jgi:hypothetical protein